MGWFSWSSPCEAELKSRLTGADHDLVIQSEDEQVKRAMAMSMGDSQILPEQETGVLEHTSFGPATRDHYEMEKWAMTISGPQPQEILLNPEPADRRRPKGAPAFFKPSPAAHRLPALLKILHAIPLAKEALLNRAHTLPDYGSERDWWDGTASKYLRIINLDLEDRQANSDDVIYESQRLMAFLDGTERAYGSTDVLAEAVVTEESHNDKVLDFYRKWYSATIRSAPDAPLVDIFTSVGTKASLENPRSETFSCLVARVDDKISGKGLTLYDLLDHILWSDNQEGEETFLEKVGDVFTVEVCNLVDNTPGLGIEIPMTWYSDRYLPTSTKQFTDMMARKARVRYERDAQERAQADMTHYSSGLNGTKIDGISLLSQAIKYFQQSAKYRDASENCGGDLSGSKTSAQHWDDPDKIAQDLKSLDESILTKIAGTSLQAARLRKMRSQNSAFERAKESTNETLKEISQMYMKPSEDPEQPPHHKYTLRGLSTTPHTLYVLEPTKPQDEDDMLSTDTKDWQWWRIEFVSSDAKPVRHTKVTEDVVLGAASTESANALLVYASQAAVSYQPAELPPQLQNFVRADNLNFSQELEGSASLRSTTPITRKVQYNHTNDLEGHQQQNPYEQSLAETRSSSEGLDSSLPGYECAPLPPSTFAKQQANPKYGHRGRFDDAIPVSLQASGSSTGSNKQFQDPSQMSNRPEMQERGVRHQENNLGQYAFSRSVPELDLEDEEDERDQRETRGD